MKLNKIKGFKMRYLYCVVISVILVVAGCDKIKNLTSDEVALVKNGTISFDKSITVGQAIDRYHYFKNTNWKVIKEENGRKIVQATGYFDTDKYYKDFNIDNKDIKSVYLQFQFIINQDKTFELGWCGQGVVKQDGTVIEPDKKSITTQCQATLKEVYTNEIGKASPAVTSENHNASSSVVAKENRFRFEIEDNASHQRYTEVVGLGEVHILKDGSKIQVAEYAEDVNKFMKEFTGPGVLFNYIKTDGTKDYCTLLLNNHQFNKQHVLFGNSTVDFIGVE